MNAVVVDAGRAQPRDRRCMKFGVAIVAVFTVLAGCVGKNAFVVGRTTCFD